MQTTYLKDLEEQIHSLEKKIKSLKKSSSEFEKIKDNFDLKLNLIEKSLKENIGDKYGIEWAGFNNEGIFIGKFSTNYVQKVRHIISEVSGIPVQYIEAIPRGWNSFNFGIGLTKKWMNSIEIK